MSNYTPKIIHQMWLDEKNPVTPHPPEKYQKYPGYISKLKELHPDYEYMWWDRQKCEELLDREDLSYFRNIYHKIPKIIMKCDFMRYVILWIYGGYYFDLDNNFRRPLPKEWTYESLGLFHEPPSLPNNKYPGMYELTGCSTFLANAIMFSSVKHEFWLIVIKEIDRRLDNCNSKDSKKPYCTNGEVLSITGPVLLSDVAVSSGYISNSKSACYFTALDNKGERWKCEDGLECINGHYCSKEQADNSIASNTWDEGTGWTDDGSDSATNFTVAIVIVVVIVVFVLIIFFLV